MRNNLIVTFNLERLVCHDEADGWGDAEPYMWTIFFKIDGTTCRLNDSLMLEGTATVFTTPGSHGNLGDTDVDDGDTVSIPSAIGVQTMALTPIPVPDFVKQAGTDDITAVAGCIVILMEEDNISDDGAEAGHRSLNSAVEEALNDIIPTLGFSNQEITDDDIESLTEKVKSRIGDAIKDQQNFFENIWSWLDRDDVIGTRVWKFSGDDLLTFNPIELQQRWQKVWQPLPPGNPLGLPGYWKDHGDWELFGNINTTEIPACPADVVKDVFDGLFGNSSSDKSMQAMYNFRDGGMKEYKGLETWWQIAKSNSYYLKSALNNKEVVDAAVSVFKDMPEILSNKEKPLNEFHFNSIEKILKYILSLNAGDRHSRKGIKRSIDALNHLRGKSPVEIFKKLSELQPTRYPFLQPIDHNFNK